MGRLGFDKENGFVFEGKNQPSYPSWPTPILSQATLIRTPVDLGRLPHGYDSHPFAWLFREDSFDPVSKIRRGRLFQRLTNGPENTLVEAHPAAFSDEKAAMHGGGRRHRELDVYYECRDLLNLSDKGYDLHLAIGVASSYSLWRIVQVERSANDDVLVTLRAESAFGILPSLNKSAVAPEYLPTVEQALNRVLDAAYKELPTSVVDQCRNAATVLAGRWLRQLSGKYQSEEKDLGQWIKAIEKHTLEEGKPRHAMLSSLQILALLHVRGKENERVKHNAREVTYDDATLALHIVGFVMRDIGWAH